MLSYDERFVFARRKSRGCLLLVELSDDLCLEAARDEGRGRHDGHDAAEQDALTCAAVEEDAGQRVYDGRGGEAAEGRAELASPEPLSGRKASTANGMGTRRGR